MTTTATIARIDGIRRALLAANSTSGLIQPPADVGYGYKSAHLNRLWDAGFAAPHSRRIDGNYVWILSPKGRQLAFDLHVYPHVEVAGIGVLMRDRT